MLPFARSALLLGLAAGLFCAQGPRAWAQLRAHLGDEVWDHYGYSVDFAGDVDLDGIPDYVIGAPRTSLFLCGGAESYAELRSGATGALLQRFELDVGEHHGAIVRGVGDVDLDGRGDVLVANSPDFDCAHHPRAYLYSGASGALLHTFVGSEWWELYEFDADKSIAPAGDVDGDGAADVVLGDADAGFGAGRVALHSGLSGALLLEVLGAPDARLGRACAGVGDWDGDGLDDVAAGGDLATEVWSATAGRLFVTPFTGLLDAPGDHDGDGQLDLLAGGRIVSGSDGSVLLDASAWPEVRMAPDLDGDGTRELVAADGGFDGARGRVALLSGADGSLLVELWRGSAPDAAHDLSAVVLGDVGGDGFADVLIGLPYGGDERGTAFIVSGWAPPAPSRYCIGAPNSAGPGARISLGGPWSLSTKQSILRADGCPPNHFGVFFYGPAPAQVPFGAGFRCVAPPLFRLWPVAGTGAAGVATRALDYRAGPMSSGAGEVLAGSSWYLQFWYRDVPGGAPYFNLSDGLAVTFSE